jgi:periplasmic protein TonB
MSQERKFTIWHGLGASVAVHLVLGLPFVVRVIAAPPEEPQLLIDLQGVVPDSEDLAEVKQAEVDQKKGALQQPRPNAPNPVKEPSPQETVSTDEPPMEAAANNEAMHDQSQPAPTPPTKTVEAPPPAPDTKAAPDDNNVKGATDYVPRSRKVTEMTDQDYGALVLKKVYDSRVVPGETKRGRLYGVTKVTFVILNNGDIRPETLKAVKSSGQPVLDAAALNAVRASVPFVPPPKEMTVTFDVAFGPRR